MERLIWGDLPQWTETFSGSGYGYGDGDGYGYGYGSGDGYGDGYLLQVSVAAWSDSQRHRWTELQADSCTLAFWRSDQSGEACNGGSGTPAKIGDMQTIQGPLEICTRRGLHATMKPEAYQGSRLWIVALHGEVQWSEDKCAALKREIIGEVPIKL